MNQSIIEEFNVLEIRREAENVSQVEAKVNVIGEISLKIIVNGEELASLLCLNQNQEALALGFLYNEGVINTIDDIGQISYNLGLQAVIMDLQPNIGLHRMGSLRSVTSGCGKCMTYIPPLQNHFKINTSNQTFSLDTILDTMKRFLHQSAVFKNIGGVHSVLFYMADYELLIEDIGRHNCVDKVTGILLQENKIEATKNGALFISGRVSSEIITKAMRLGIPVIVSRSTPTSTAVHLAQQYGITLLGYVRGEKATIYSNRERICL